MSTIRAITQLIKSRAKLQKKLEVLDEEKTAAIAATEQRYAAKEQELKEQFEGTEKALHALGVTPEDIEKLTKELTE